MDTPICVSKSLRAVLTKRSASASKILLLNTDDKKYLSTSVRSCEVLSSIIVNKLSRLRECTEADLAKVSRIASERVWRAKRYKTDIFDSALYRQKLSNGLGSLTVCSGAGATAVSGSGVVG